MAIWDWVSFLGGTLCLVACFCSFYTAKMRGWSVELEESEEDRGGETWVHGGLESVRIIYFSLLEFERLDFGSIYTRPAPASFLTNLGICHRSTANLMRTREG